MNRGVGGEDYRNLRTFGLDFASVAAACADVTTAGLGGGADMDANRCSQTTVSGGVISVSARFTPFSHGSNSTGGVWMTTGPTLVS